MSSALWQSACSSFIFWYFYGLITFHYKNTEYSEYSVANSKNMNLIISDIVRSTVFKEPMTILTHTLKSQCNLSLKVNVYLDKQCAFSVANQIY